MTTLPNRSASSQPGEAVAGLGQGHDRVDHRAHAGRLAQLQQPAELGPGAHRRADDPQLQEEHPVELGRRVEPARRAAHDDRPARAQRLERVRPGRLAHGLHHGVDPLGQPGTGGERLGRTELHRPRPLGLVAAGDPHPEARGRGQRDQRRRDASPGALHQDGVPRREPGLGEQHPVRREPGRRQAGRVGPGEPGRLGHQVGAGDDDLLGQRALVHLGQQRAPRVQRLVTGPPGRGDDGVDDDLVAVIIDARAVAAQGHRQPIRRQANAFQAPQVVVVEARRAQPHPGPAVGHVRAPARSPTSSPDSGSSVDCEVAKAASIPRP